MTIQYKRSDRIPCDECLVLPACKNKEFKECDKLASWLLNAPNTIEKREELFKCFGVLQGVFTVDAKRNGGRGGVILT